MTGNTLVIARKELAKFFSNRVSAVASIVLPGLLIFALWSLMGGAMEAMVAPTEGARPTVAVENLPESIADAAASAGVEALPVASLPDAAQMRERIEAGDVQAFARFPEGFDEAVEGFDPSSGEPAPQVGVFASSADADSSRAASEFAAMLDAYESSLSNRFDVNAGAGPYDVAEQRDVAGKVVVSIVPFLLLTLLFTGVMSVAADSVAGEKERGTMAALLAAPILRSDIALGKLLAVTLVGLLTAASSLAGVFAGLSNMMGGSLDLNVYGPVECALLALVAASTALLLGTLITVVSALASSVKEANMYLTPLLIAVMAAGLLGMFGFGGDGPWASLVPLCNSVQCMIGIFAFDFQPADVAACVVVNLAATGAGVLALRRMLDSERLMLAR